MGKTKDVFKVYTGNGIVYRCSACINVKYGPHEERQLTTGLHTVSDITCVECQTVLGWTYVKAHEPTQKYKEGKFILEKQYILQQQV